MGSRQWQSPAPGWALWGVPRLMILFGEPVQLWVGELGHVALVAPFFWWLRFWHLSSILEVSLPPRLCWQALCVQPLGHPAHLSGYLCATRSTAGGMYFARCTGRRGNLSAVWRFSKPCSLWLDTLPAIQVQPKLSPPLWEQTSRNSPFHAYAETQALSLCKGPSVQQQHGAGLLTIHHFYAHWNIFLDKCF